MLSASDVVIYANYDVGIVLQHEGRQQGHCRTSKWGGALMEDAANLAETMVLVVTVRSESGSKKLGPWVTKEEGYTHRAAGVPSPAWKAVHGPQSVDAVL